MDYEPLNEWLLVKRLDEDSSKIGGIHIPDQYQKPSNRGVVVEVGSEVKTHVQVGDLVLFSEYSNMPIELDGEEFLLVRSVDTFLRKKNNASVIEKRTPVLSGGIRA
jgi:co-chaperonin GroES (HSP10)